VPAPTFYDRAWGLYEKTVAPPYIAASLLPPRREALPFSLIVVPADHVRLYVLKFKKK